ncbi:hypothetical protein UT4_19380 [Ferrigenium sp. UT4]
MGSTLKRCAFWVGCWAGLCVATVQAQPLDEVTLEYQASGIVATIHLSSPVRYLRHFPLNGGETLEIFYERIREVGADEPWVDNEVRQSPPSNLFPAFTVTTRGQQSAPRLVIQFARAAEYSVTPGADQRSFLLTIKPDHATAAPVTLPLLPTVVPLPAVAPADANLAENNRQGFALMTAAREALAAKKNDEAIEALNKLLLLPPNDYTETAQEWVGVARERAAQFDKAKIEYDLYLNLYPQGKGVPRVMQRLANLGGKRSEAGIVEAGNKKQAARWMTFGGLTSRYYFSRSQIDSTTFFNNASDKQSLSLTDQSMLITTEDVTGRYVTDNYDGRLVFRGSHTKNFLSNQTRQNRITALYGEFKGRTQDYLVRAGRQSATGGGVGGRFDGLSGGYGDAQAWRVNAVTGALVDYSNGAQPSFYGASVDHGPYSAYAINQTVDGVLDRRAVGGEWRYFQDKRSAYALLDYDTNFSALNAAQLSGTLGLSGMSLNMLLDHRKTPSLSIRTALNGAETQSINALQQVLSASALRDLALARTATTNLGQVGVVLPFADQWQVGGDLRLSNTTGLPASGVAGTPGGFLAAIPSRGTEKIVTGQVIGSNLYRTGDIWSLSGSLGSSGTVNTSSLFLYNHNMLGGGWTLDASLQLYRQTDQFDAVTTRISPTVRGEYAVNERFSVDFDGGIERSQNKGNQVSTTTLRYFGSTGLRWYF